MSEPVSRFDAMSPAEFDDWLTRMIEREQARRRRHGWIPVTVPVEQAFGKRHMSESVMARIRRLNPDGLTEGERPRGWHPHPRIERWNMDVIGPKEFIARYGREAYHSVPRSALFRQGHRKAITAQYAVEHNTK